MYNPYDVHSWSTQYHEEALRQARVQHLEKQMRTKFAADRDGLHQGKEVLSMKRIVLVFVVAAMMAASIAFSASAAFASHPHYLSTPGTCVEDVASGQTSKGPGEGGYHKFHDHVHKGQPGMVAFEKENNSVSVSGTQCS